MIMKRIKPTVIYIIIVFMLGLYFIFNYSSKDACEGFLNEKEGTRCPNILIQKGSRIYLYNSNLAKVPGINPIEFNNLEEYVEFIEWQRSQGIMCPVLFLQHMNDAQGQDVYKMRPSPTDLQGGLPPSVQCSAAPTVSTALMDSNSSTSDPLNYINTKQQHVLKPLDAVAYVEQLTGKSANPMDNNWGGTNFTQQLIDSNFYAGNNI